MDKQQINRRMRKMLIFVGILFGAIFLYKFFIGMLIKHKMQSQSQVVTVSAMKVTDTLWQPQIKASGSLRAIRGVNVTTELPGIVQKIDFKPGAFVKEGDVLVQLNADNDVALLHSLQANAELANTTDIRNKAQYLIHAISKATLDTSSANLKSLRAQVNQQAAVVAKKTIRAPFSGRLGINAVNPGQYLNPGDTIVMLQTLDPIYVDFSVPQQMIAQLKLGQTVTIKTDAAPNKTFTGKITTINPALDATTRNVQVEATLNNVGLQLAPGMFVAVDVMVGKAEHFLTLPQTAITFNSYGDSVYIINQDKEDKNKLTVKQAFVVTGKTRGDQIQILKGLKEGMQVVTSGQLKLKNEMEVKINNAIQPTDNPAPELRDGH